MQPQTDIALILLASGLSRRFGHDDKLLAPLGGKPLLSYSAALTMPNYNPYRLAVIDAEIKAREDIVQSQGWDIIRNPNPMDGQAASLALAIKHLQALAHIRACIIILADMPFVSEVHLEAMVSRASDPISAVISRYQGTLCPPTLFKRDSFEALAALSGDKGAKSVLRTLEHVSIIDLPDLVGVDIDSPNDLLRSQRLMTERGRIIDLQKKHKVKGKS